MNPELQSDEHYTVEWNGFWIYNNHSEHEFNTYYVSGTVTYDAHTIAFNSYPMMWVLVLTYLARKHKG